MKYTARIAVFAAALTAAVPFASSSTFPTGTLNTVGGSAYNYLPNQTATMNVTSAGVGTLDLAVYGLSTGVMPGLVTPPSATGSFTAFYPSATVIDFSFSTSSISSATPTEILSISNGTDTLAFYATSVAGFTPTDLTTEGAIMLDGYLAATDPTFSSDQSAELDIAANGLGNNFTEDLVATAPEPGSLVLLGTGLFGTAGALLRRFRNC